MTIRIWRADGQLDGLRRTGGETRDLLKAGAVSPTVELYPRSDGPGSSQDLLQFAAMGSRVWKGTADLHDPAWSWSKGALRTPGACIGSEPIRFRAVPATDEREVQYYAPDFHEEAVTATDVVPGDPRQFVNNILVEFGLQGVRIEADPVPAVYRGTGLGGSNLAHGAALILASSLSGADISLAQVYVWGTILENNFGVRLGKGGAVSFGVSMTGGQELLTALQGGFYDNVHVPFVYGAHSVVSREIVAPKDYATLESHLVLVNLGQRRKGAETSSSVNTQWMKAWLTSATAARHLEKIEIAYRGVEALRSLDFAAYAHVIGEYRRIRVDLCDRYTAGQEELEGLCEKYSAEYFPVGAGSGTCLVCAAEEESITEIARAIRETEDSSTGRTVIPFRVRAAGASFLGFEELGLQIPRAPGEIPD